MVAGTAVEWSWQPELAGGRFAHLFLHLPGSSPSGQEDSWDHTFVAGEDGAAARTNPVLWTVFPDCPSRLSHSQLPK